MGENLRFYADKECKKPITEINWDNAEKTLQLIDGSIQHYDNVLSLGEIATATVYVRNETSWKYGVQSIVTPQGVKYKIENAWLHPMRSVKLQLIVPVQENTMLKTKEIEIRGFFERMENQ